MKKYNNISNKVVQAMGIPEDLAYKEPIITIMGNKSVCIENYKGIKKFTNTNIIVRTYKGEVIIAGNKMYLDKYISEEAVISGDIYTVEINKRTHEYR